MLGAMIGDICGAAYEFHNDRDIKNMQLFKDGCRPTDDSAMTAAVGRALMDGFGMDESGLRELLIDSMHYYGDLLPEAGYGGRFSHWLEDHERKPYNSWGNGSGMRVSAAGWLYSSLEETRHFAALTAMTTHNHPEGIKGAETIAGCTYLARKGESKDSIRRYVEENFYPLNFTLDEIRPEYAFDMSCQGSCPQAVEAFLEGNSYEDVILKAISLGGDSDTIGAMAGAIAEAYYGIPEQLQKRAFGVMEKDKNIVLKNEVLHFRSFLLEHHLDVPKVI